MDTQEFSLLSMDLVKSDFGKMIYHGENTASTGLMEKKSLVKASTKDMANKAVKKSLRLRIIKARLQELVTT